MRNAMRGRPEAGEYAPDYEIYVSKVPEDDVESVLELQM